MMFKIEVRIEAEDESAAQTARDELANGGQDSKDAGDVPHGTFSFGELQVVRP